MKKTTLIGLVTTLAVAACIALTGCGANTNQETISKDQETISKNQETISKDQEAISKDLTVQLDSFKQSSADNLSSIFKENVTYLEMIGIDPDEFAKACVDGFEYKIGTITVNGNNGTADVTLTTKTANTILPIMVSNIFTAAGNLTTADFDSQDKLLKMVGEQLLSATKSAKGEPITITLTYSKDSNGKWSMDDLETQLYKALGLDSINLGNLCKQLGVSDLNELATHLKQYVS